MSVFCVYLHSTSDTLLPPLPEPFVRRGEPATIYEKLNSFLGALPVEKKLSAEESQTLSAFAAVLVAKDRAAALPPAGLAVLGTSPCACSVASRRVVPRRWFWELTPLYAQSAFCLCWRQSSFSPCSICCASPSSGPPSVLLSPHPQVHAVTHPHKCDDSLNTQRTTVSVA